MIIIGYLTLSGQSIKLYQCKSMSDYVILWIYNIMHFVLWYK
jgi:hypothetical protein